MFRKLVRKLQGIESHEELLRKSESYFQQLANSANFEGHAAFRKLSQSKEWYAEWRVAHSQLLEDVANVDTQFEQVIALRKVIMEEVDASTLAALVIREEFSDSDRRVLVNQLCPNEPYDSAAALQARIWAYAEVSNACLRMLSLERGDARKDDWFPMYVDLYGQYMKHAFAAMIADAKGDVSAMASLLPAMKQMVEQTREKILQGNNWEYDKDKLEEEQEQEDRERQEKKPPRQKTVRKAQIDELVAYMEERFGRLRTGELYAIQGHSPSDPASALKIDTGIMLIALDECVADRQTAINALREVVYKLGQRVTKIDPPLPREKIPLDEQIEVLKLSEEEDGWLPQICVMATYMLYDINAEKLSKEEHLSLAEASAENIDDCWEVYATTKKVFGYDYKIERMFTKE